jgi:ABC-type uncharacterized transport system, permease component
MSQMEYRINFISSILFELAYFLVKLSYAFVVVSTGMRIGDIGPYDIVVFIGAYTIITGFFVFISPAIFSFSYKVYTGELDYYLTKPVSPVVISTFSCFNLGSCLANVLSGIGLVIWGCLKAQHMPSLFSLLMGVVLIVLGLILSYFMFLLPQLLSFWLLKVDKMNMTLWSLWDFNNMPMVIYPKPIQRIGLFIIPIFLVTNPSGFALIGRGDIGMPLIALIVTMALYLVFLAVWKRGIRRYHSSNLS